MEKKKRVLVGMSGGVDSSVCALLLLRQGYEVAGATLRLHSCAESDDGDQAREVCRELGIAHYTLDESALFRTAVMDYFVRTYCEGGTPNPCIECNRHLKFGAMLDWALENGFDYIATGHYAQTAVGADGAFRLLRGADRRKDQSYVLYRLTQHQLSHLLLPLGGYDKPAIRALAEENGLVTAHKSDSQDICFIPDGDYVRFLCEYGGVTPKSGNFVDSSGRVLGQHRGLVCYTCGQRRGLGISAGKTVYVVRKDEDRNTVVLGDERELFSRTLTASDVNWIGGRAPDGAIRVRAKTRYSQSEADATVEGLADGRIRVTFDEPQRAITAGQSVVLYDGEAVLGGGVIEK